MKAEILVKMGAMSMKFTGTVAIIERDDDGHRAVMQVKSREAGGQGYANADVTLHTRRRWRDRPHGGADLPARRRDLMGEGVVSSVLDWR